MNLYVLMMKLIVSWNGLQTCSSGAFITSYMSFQKSPLNNNVMFTRVMRRKREGQDHNSCVNIVIIIHVADEFNSLFLGKEKNLSTLSVTTTKPLTVTSSRGKTLCATDCEHHALVHEPEYVTCVSTALQWARSPRCRTHGISRSFLILRPLSA